MTSWGFSQQPFSTNISIKFTFKKEQQYNRLEPENNTEVYIKPFNLRIGDLTLNGFNIETDHFYIGKSEDDLESEIMHARKMLPEKSHPKGRPTENTPFHFSSNMGSSEKNRLFAPLVSKLVTQRNHELSWQYIEKREALKSRVEILAGVVVTFIIYGAIFI